MMQSRSQCNRCMQRLSGTSNAQTIECPACKSQNITQSVNPIVKSQDRGQSSFRRSIVTTKSKISQRGSKSDKSLNCRPSPLLSSKSSTFSGERPARKRALLIGVTYTRTKHKLKGTIVDVKSFRSFLMERFKFQEENILVLTEEEPEAEHVPTKKNIENSFKWLVEECKAGDSLVFYFSGHGVRQLDTNDDESDGFDETICPVDFMKEGMISDDQIMSAIVRPLRKGVTLNAIVDACHSGSVLDLPYMYNMKDEKWENKNRSSKDEKRTNGLAISISACEDRQVAADASSCFGGKSSLNGGAMSCILMDIVRKNDSITYGKLLDSIYASIAKANKEGFFPVIIKRVLRQILSQKPQLSASEEFDIYEKHFVL